MVFKNNVRKHQGIIQTGGNRGKLKKGYRYSGKKLKNGLPQIIKSKKRVKSKKIIKQVGGTNHRKQIGKEIIEFRKQIGKKIIKLAEIFFMPSQVREFINEEDGSLELLLQLIELNSEKGLILPEKVTNSGGYVLIMIFDDFVIKLFKYRSIWEKVVHILKKVSKCPHIISMKGAYTDEKGQIYAIVTEKLTPISKLIYNQKKERTELIVKLDNSEVFNLFENIGEALVCLNKLDFAQGDCRFDNIGRIGAVSYTHLTLPTILLV